MYSSWYMIFPGWKIVKTPEENTTFFVSALCLPRFPYDPRRMGICDVHAARILCLWLRKRSVYITRCLHWSLSVFIRFFTMADNGTANFKPFPHFATDAIHAGQEPEQWNSRAVVPPISLATTFKQKGPGELIAVSITSDFLVFLAVWPQTIWSHL